MTTTAIRRSAVTVAAVAAAGFGGAAIAGATGNSSTAQTQRSADREALPADVAAKVKAAALEKVPGATVLRTEAGGPYGTKYHAHVQTANGTPEVVLVDADFEATAVQADRGRGGRPGGRGGDRQALSADIAAKVKAAALEEVPGATVLRTEAGGPYGTRYHAHVRTADGALKVVLVDAGFEATAVQADQGRGGRPGGRGMGETPLTGTTKERVEAAVLAKYPGATIERTETNGDPAAAYEAHITTSAGKELEVLVDEDFQVVDAREHPGRP